MDGSGWRYVWALCVLEHSFDTAATFEAMWVGDMLHCVSSMVVHCDDGVGGAPAAFREIDWHIALSLLCL